MEKLLEKLRSIEGVKNIKLQSGPVLKINLFSNEIPGNEAEEIKGDLRKISPKIRNRLEKARKNSEISSWNWIRKPQKQYTETSIGTEKISDRKPKGHRPPYYTVSIEK